jgi:hypothetical protein
LGGWVDVKRHSCDVNAGWDCSIQKIQKNTWAALLDISDKTCFLFFSLAFIGEEKEVAVEL